MTPARPLEPARTSPTTETRAQLTEVVDGRSGAVRASGHLTPQGADLLRGTVEGLLRLGHSTVLLDLTGVRAADDVGLHVLSDLRSSMAASGDRLLLRNAPMAVGTSPTAG